MMAARTRDQTRPTLHAKTPIGAKNNSVASSNKAKNGVRRGFQFMRGEKGNGTQEAQEAQEVCSLLVPLVLLVFRSLPFHIPRRCFGVINQLSVAQRPNVMVSAVSLQRPPFFSSNELSLVPQTSTEINRL